MDSPFLIEPPREFPACPICSGKTEVVYSRHGENVLVCVECHTGLTIPRNAWEIADVKRARAELKPDKKTG